MNINDAVLDRVRSANPVDATVAIDWSRSGDGRRVLDTVICAEVVAVPARHRRRARRLVVTAVVVTGGLTTAAAATGVLGRLAPDRVRDHLAALDKGLPADLRLNPDVEHARAVAYTPSGVLYAADLSGGGYCIEVVTDGDRPRGAACVTPAHLGDRAIEVTAPIPFDPGGALLVGGRINDQQVTKVEARYASGRSEDATPGLERYWLIEVPSSERDSALTNGLIVAGVGADGHDVSTLSVPALRDDDPTGTKLDRSQPIFVSTISAGDDLTLVLGVEGSVNVADAAKLELQYPDGTTAIIPIGSGGAYRLMLPTDRQDDFATTSGRIIARDSAGEIVAMVAVSSVANTRRGG